MSATAVPGDCRRSYSCKRSTPTKANSKGRIRQLGLPRSAYAAQLHHGILRAALREEITPESRAQYCEIIRDNRRQLRFLFDDMLEVAYLENLHAPLPCQYTNLCAVCQAQLRIMKVRYPKPGIVYKGAIPVAEIALNTSDKYLTILISALLGNAYKFTQEGTISLECDRLGDDRVFVAVADTAAGIPPEKHGYVFERFTKLDPFSQGNGLGLYLCRLIVTHLHGEIYIDSGYTAGRASSPSCRAGNPRLHPLPHTRCPAVRGTRPRLAVFFPPAFSAPTVLPDPRPSDSPIPQSPVPNDPACPARQHPAIPSLPAPHPAPNLSVRPRHPPHALSEMKSRLSGFVTARSA